MQIQETTLYPELVQHLRNMGFQAIGETKIEGGKRPDIIFEYDGLRFVLEVKLDDSKVVSNAFAQAVRYGKTLGIENIIAVIFPKSLKKQNNLFANINDLVLAAPIYATVVSDVWSEDIAQITFPDLIKELKRLIDNKEQNIDFPSIVNRINTEVISLTDSLRLANRQALATEIVDKLDLFSAIGDFKDKDSAYKQVINLASFLFFNQILFYHVFHKKTTEEVPPLHEIRKVEDVQTFFDAIQRIDYKSIYRINILGHLPDEPQIIKTLNDIIIAIQALRAEYITHDLAGRFFHELIPHEVRKVLAAFYTHPNAADLLAQLIVHDANATVIDPSCGSGTLLVAAYKRKYDLYKKLFGYQNAAAIHKQFVEKDITGIDIMPFAAHISTINITMQNIAQVTNIVRFATRDALDLASPLNTGEGKRAGEFFGIDIEGYNETIQNTLFKIYEQKKIKRGAINPEGESEGFKLTLNDVVIMNPPYSDREKMPQAWKDKLNENTTLNSRCGNLVNLWGYFLVLGDLLLEQEGIMGAVIPINFARGEASQKVRDFIIDNHYISHIIKPVGDLAFSEGAAFRDILLITQKRKPTKEDKTKIVYFKKSIREIKNEDMRFYTDTINQYPQSVVAKPETKESQGVDVFEVTLQEIQDKRKNLMHFLWANSYESYQAFDNFTKTLKKDKLIDFPKKFVRDSYTSSGFKGLIEGTFITNPFDKHRAERAFMVLAGEDKTHYKIRIKNTELAYKVPKEKCYKALRTLTGIRTMQITDKHDFWIESSFDDFEEIARLSPKLGKNFEWETAQKKSKDKFVNLAIAMKINIYSPNTALLAVYCDDEILHADVFKIFPNIPKEQAKILCLYFNSTISIIQAMLNKSEATGMYAHLKETDLLNFQLLDYDKLTQEDRKNLVAIFDEVSQVEMPSILEQIEGRFEKRVEIDIALLKVLGYKQKEINDLLPALYETITRELKQYF